MKIYFDESYPPNKEVLILGALFLSDKNHRDLTQRIKTIKKQYNLHGELKYSKLTTRNKLDAAIEISREFFSFDYPYMRICIVPYNSTGLVNVTGKSIHRKRVKVYVDSAIKLIINNVPPNFKINLFMDEELSIAKTNLYAHLTKINIANGAKFDTVTAINSKDKTKELNQLCDLFIGSVYSDLYSNKTKKSRYKRSFSKHVLGKLKVPSFKNEYWSKYKTCIHKKAHPKFIVSYWGKADISYKKQKNRS